MSLHGLTPYVSFDKSVGMIARVRREARRLQRYLDIKSTGFHLSRIQVEDMRLILDDSAGQERYREDTQLVEDIGRIEKHQERMAPIIEHLKVQAKT